MHGIKPEDIQHLLPLCGTTLTQICVGEYQIIFHFHPAGSISVEGHCELLEPTRTVVDSWDRGARSENFRFCDLLRQSVIDISIDSPKSFVATFSNSWRLRVVDDSEQYESFSVGGLFV
jgi:hypothetical protein